MEIVEIEELLNQLDALAKRIDDMMRDVRDLTYREFKLKEKIRLTLEAATAKPSVCAMCESDEIGESSDGGDEIVTMCRDCGAIEQGYKK